MKTISKFIAISLLIVLSCSQEQNVEPKPKEVREQLNELLQNLKAEGLPNDQILERSKAFLLSNGFREITEKDKEAYAIMQSKLSEIKSRNIANAYIPEDCEVTSLGTAGSNGCLAFVYSYGSGCGSKAGCISNDWWCGMNYIGVSWIC